MEYSYVLNKLLLLSTVVNMGKRPIKEVLDVSSARRCVSSQQDNRDAYHQRLTVLCPDLGLRQN